MTTAALGLSAPTITTTTSGSGPWGSRISDTAQLTGGSGETGSITFQLYGPENLTCTGAPVAASTVAVNGDGNYFSEGILPDGLGTYDYVASYSGDLNNAPATTVCGDPLETVTVAKGAPAIVTTVSGSTLVGGQLSDAARLSGGYSPHETGSITFNLFGPDDASCSRPPAFTSTVPVEGENRYASSPFTATAPGMYRFTATYSGNAENMGVATACDDPGEAASVLESAGHTTLTVHASPAVFVGEQILGTAILSVPGNPTGVITFQIFGPDDTTCGRGAVTASTRTVNGNGSYSSDPFTPVSPGVYQFVASYSGDASNAAAVSECADLSAAVGVTVPPPVLAKSFNVTRVSGDVLVRPPGAAAGGPARAHARAVGFVRVTQTGTFPIGSSVEVSTGVARLTTAVAGAGGIQSGVFSRGRFEVTQSRDAHGLTELHLYDDPSAVRACTHMGMARAARRRLPKRVIARLHSHVAGHFRTDGRYSSTSAHGTVWETLDRCDGTLTRVLRDSVVVDDFVRHRKVVLHAGRHYLASAP
jgi:hypothetical protein